MDLQYLMPSSLISCLIFVFIKQSKKFILRSPTKNRGFFLKKKLGFTPCKAEQPLQDMELHEKEAQKD